MSDAGEKIVYVAGDVEVSPHQRSVRNMSQVLSIGKKSFDILLTLLQADGDVVTKDDLFASVWPGQIVTDAALNKQITRLRQVIDVDSDNSIIKTVRGVGFSISVPIQRKNLIQQKVTRQNLKYAFLGMAFLFLLAVTIISSQRKDPASTEPVNEIKVAMMPAGLSTDWLSAGSVSYVAQRLKKNSSIEAITSEKDWFKKIQPQQLAIELVNAEGIDYALLVNSRQTQDQFQADLILRNIGGIVAQDEIVAVSLPLLFEKIENWVLLALPLTVEPEVSTQQIQRSDYVLESYLRGLAAEYERNFIEAAQLMQTAVSQDATFTEAWLRLAAIEAELGHYQKALGLTETISDMSDLDDDVSMELYLVKSRIYIYLNRLEEAQELVDLSIETAQQKNDQQALIRALANQAAIQDRYGEVNADTLALVKQQLELVKQYQPLPNTIATLNRNLAAALWLTGEHQQAKDKLTEAVSQFERSGNEAGLLASYRLLADIDYELARHGDALLALEKGEYLLNQVDEPILLARFFMSKARNQLEWGLKQEALQSIDALNQLGVAYSTQQAKVKGYAILVELYVSYRQFAQARTTADQLLAIVIQNPEQYPSDALYVAAIDMYLSARMESPELARTKLQTYQQNYPGIQDMIPQEWPRIEAQILAQEGYTQDALSLLQPLFEAQIKRNKILEARYVGYEMLDMQWNFDMQAYATTLSQLLELDGFDYPVLKYQAQLQAHNKQFVEASATLYELKAHAGQFWTAKDQLLLESYQQEAQNNGDTADTQL